MLDPLGRIDVPAVGRPPRTATRLVVGQVRAGAWIVGLLGLPGDQTTLHINLPAARAGTVHTVGGTCDLVMLPARAVGLFPGTVFVDDLAMAFREGRLDPRQELQPIQKITHILYLIYTRAGSRYLPTTNHLPKRRGTSCSVSGPFRPFREPAAARHCRLATRSLRPVRFPAGPAAGSGEARFAASPGPTPFSTVSVPPCGHRTTRSPPRSSDRTG